MTISQSESNIYGARFARAELPNDFREEQFLEELIENQADICRVKINASASDVFLKLDKLGMPYQLYNINYTNKALINDSMKSESWSSDYQYELFDGSQGEMMKELVCKAIEKKSWVNYPSAFSKGIITPEKELEATAEFACSFSFTENASARAWLLKYRGNYIGFFMGYEREGFFEGILYGIIPEYAGKGHSKIIYQIMLHICAKNDWKYFVNDVGILNIPSQRSATGQGLVPQEIYFHFEIYSFLSKTEKEPIEGTIKLEDTFESSIIDKITRELNLKNFRTVNHVKINEIEAGKPCYYYVSFPATDLVVVKIAQQRGYKYPNMILYFGEVY
ncbi:MAG: hypothetical protein COA57_08225 [Flavobacteriales bacterium]|nr:hypothetical protein [Bacteroidales bacterium AH-315-I05]PCJ85088.1 MAG: hypothetical protein COA57_08225 [Flavobacteriales bacterium]